MAQEKSLNRQIAELKGWKVERAAPGSFRLRAPNLVVTTELRAHTEIEAWLEAERRRLFPDWKNSLDASEQEFPDGMHMTLTREYDRVYYCELWLEGMKPDDYWCGTDDTRSQAVAIALLQYERSQVQVV